MGRVVFEENYRAHFVPTIVDKAAPTVAEITAGTEITSFIPTDGLSFGATNNRVAADSLAEAYDAEIMGTYGHQLSLTCFFDATTDDAWDTFERGERGFLVFARYGYTGTGDPKAPAASDSVMVFPVETGEPVPANSAKNTRQSFTVEFAVTSKPNTRAAIAAA